MADEYDDVKKKSFSTRFFVETDNNSYVVAMFVACTAVEAGQYEAAKLAEVSYDVYESIGENSQYVEGKVIQGEPRIVPFTKESADSVRKSLIDLAVQSISVIQLKLQAGRNLTFQEKTKLNRVLDYVDELSAIDSSKAPDITFPKIPD